ncbi:MAG: hypothetical protein AAGA48_39705 [Myxococcota bacterium]
MTRVFLVLGLLGACRNDPTPPQLLDTGWFTEDDAPGCPHEVVSTLPEDGTGGWFYLDVPRVFTGTTDASGYEAWLADAEGRRIATTTVWSEADSAFDLVPDEPLPPGTSFQLVVQDCIRTTEISFATSGFGQALTDEGANLAGRTFRLDLGGADWIRPEGLGPVIGSFLTEPILLGVVYADDSNIDLLGAPSQVNSLGQVSQAQEPTWDFPLAEFDPSRPTFVTRADAIELVIRDSGVEGPIPVTEFVLTGTLSADGTRLGGGTLAGVADTREFSDAFFGTENALCLLSESSFQVACAPCESDGEPFCLAIENRNLSGTQQEGLTLVNRAP